MTEYLPLLIAGLVAVAPFAVTFLRGDNSSNSVRRSVVWSD
jgi:hypothetical protein